MYKINRASPIAQVVKNPRVMQETQETWVQSLGWEDPLEEEMETHSSTLARKIPWKGEPAGLWSMGYQRERTESTEHVSMRKLDNKNLLYLTGNSMQCSVAI